MPHMRSSGEMTSGGASRIVEPWVSLASTPRAISASQTIRPVPIPGSTSTPAHRPRVRTPTTPWPSRVSSRSRSSDAELGGAGLVLAGAEHLDHGEADRAGQRVAAEGAAVLAGAEHAEDVLVGDDRGDRDDAAAERLAEDVDVGDDALVVAGEGLAGAAEAGLDLVGGEQHVVLGAEVADAAQVAVRRDDHAALALDRLDQDRDGVGVDRGLDRGQVAVGDGDEAGRERAEAVAGVGVVGEADDGGGPAVEVAGGDDDLGLVGGDALDLVAPLAGDLDRGLDGLGAGVHRQHEVLAAQVAERGGEVGEPVVHERPAGERQLVELGVGGGEQRGVAVAEVERGVAGQQVEEATAVDVGHPGALGVGDHHRQRVVVVRGARLGPLELAPSHAGRVGRLLLGRRHGVASSVV